MKKIAFFHPYFAFGGVEKTNIRLAEYFIRHGYIIDFLSLSFSSHLSKEMDDLGINRITLEANRTFGAILELHQYMKSQMKQYDLTFISCQNFANLVAIFACPLNRAGLKLIVSERLHPVEFEYNGKAKKGKLIIALMKLFYKKADIIVANSKETADALTKIIGKKAIFIYNPTLTGNYLELAQEPVEKSWFKEEIPIVISTGRLSKEKGFDTLIKAFAILQKKMNARLVIIGEGEQRKELEALVAKLQLAEKVWMPGYDSNPYKYVQKADVFVLSSLFEGLPNTLIEALAVGTNCVATMCKSGPREILLEGKGGYLVEVKNEYAMADAIYKALVDKQGATAMRKVAEAELYRFTPEEVGKRYLEVIEE